MSEESQPSGPEKQPLSDKTALPELQIPKEVQTLINDLPGPQQKAVQAILVAFQIQRSWRGPLPPPDILKGYNDAVPDGAERILRMAEKQSQHRMDMEKKVIP